MLKWSIMVSTKGETATASMNKASDNIKYSQLSSKVKSDLKNFNDT